MYCTDVVLFVNANTSTFVLQQLEQKHIATYSVSPGQIAHNRNIILSQDLSEAFKSFFA